MADVLKTVLLILHFAGIAGLAVGVGAALHKKIKQARGAVWHSSLLMLLSGIGLVAVDSLANEELDHGKVAVKFLVLLIISAIAFRLNRGAKTATDSGSTGQYLVIGLLTVLNILIAATI